MSLKLEATTNAQLSELLEAVWDDAQVNVVEHSKLRRESDRAVEALTAQGVYVRELEALQHHADALVGACVALARAVYASNIKPEAATERQSEAGLHAQLQEQIQLQQEYESTAGKRLAQDDHTRKALIEQRRALIQAVEYQIAYVVIGFEATVGKMMI